MRGGGEALTFKCVILDTKENVQKKYFFSLLDSLRPLQRICTYKENIGVALSTQ